MHFFSRDGTCPLLLIKEMYALSLVNRLVYIRFWTKDAKFKAEAKIKAFKAQNPGYQFITSRPSLEKSPLTSGRVGTRLSNIFMENM